MSLANANPRPTRTELRVFAALWAVFFLVLGRLAALKPDALLVAAGVTATAWLVSVIFNRGTPRRDQLIGAAVPLGLFMIGSARRFAVPQTEIEYALWGVGGAGAAVALASSGAAGAMYQHWLRAAAPTGWTISHLLLATVYYLLFTPLGLLMRARGHDPIKHPMDRTASTHWVVRSKAPDPSQYFRQF